MTFQPINSTTDLTIIEETINVICDYHQVSSGASWAPDRGEPSESPKFGEIWEHIAFYEDASNAKCCISNQYARSLMTGESEMANADCFDEGLNIAHINDLITEYNDCINAA